MKGEKNIKQSELLETAESASAYAEARLEEVRSEYQKRKIKLMKISGMMIIVSIVLVFATRSWFTMSRSVEGTDANMTASDLPFEIRTVENSNTSYWNDYKALINKADTSFKDGQKQTITVNETSKDYYNTTGNYESIVWRLESSDLTDDENIYNDGLKPDSSGTLKFEIIPKVSGNFAVDIKLDIRGFSATYPTQAQVDAGTYPNLDTVVSLSEITQSSENATVAEKNAVNYINGHILFFDNKTTVGEKDYYSVYFENNIYHYQTDSAVAGNPEPIEIHWIWVNTIDQIILMSTDTGANPIIVDPLVSNDQAAKDRANLIGHISNHANYIFDNIDSFDDYSHDDETDEDTLTFDFSSVLSSLNYNTFKNSSVLQSKMADSYNAADQIIGTNLDYVLIDMKVIEGKMQNE